VIEIPMPLVTVTVPATVVTTYGITVTLPESTEICSVTVDGSIKRIEIPEKTVSTMGVAVTCTENKIELPVETAYEFTVTELVCRFSTCQ
jgi:hypothetical protein